MKRRIWSLDDARAALADVIEFTEAAVRKSGAIAQQLQESILPENEQEAREEELQSILNRWAAEVMELGADVKGLWLVDFDNGEGYWCWKFGEDGIYFEHTYEAGFSGRRPIDEGSSPDERTSEWRSG